MMWFFLLFILLALFVVVWTVKKLHFDHKDCSITSRLDGKIAVVTGCNTGIGYEVVGELARRGAQVIMACRDLKKAEVARSSLLELYGKELMNQKHPYLSPIVDTQLICEQLDLNSPKSIHHFADRLAEKLPCLHILVNNAAINLKQPQYDALDGIEAHLKVNYLGHFLLTNLLYPLLRKVSTISSDLKVESDKYTARVINVSSFNHKLAELNLKDLNRPNVGSAYSNSKLANVIHAKELSKRWFSSSTDVVAVSLHPGLVRTDLFRYTPLISWLVHKPLGWLSKSPWQGAQTILYCCLTDCLIPGGYYCECRLSKINPQASDDHVGDILWEKSEELIKIWRDSEKSSY